MWTIIIFQQQTINFIVQHNMMNNFQSASVSNLICQMTDSRQIKVQILNSSMKQVCLYYIARFINRFEY